MDSCGIYSDRFTCFWWEFSAIDGGRYATSVSEIQLPTENVNVYFSIYELERLAQVPNKFQFPLFETFHWYAAKTFYEELKGSSDSNCKQ